MKKKTKVIIIIFSIISILLFIIGLTVVSIQSFKRYVLEKLTYNVEGTILNSSVLEEKIGKIEKVEFKLSPIFYYKNINIVGHQAELSFEVTTTDNKNHIIIALIDSSKYPFYESEIYAYKIGDEIIYEEIINLDNYDKNDSIEILN